MKENFIISVCIVLVLFGVLSMAASRHTTVGTLIECAEPAKTGKVICDFETPEGFRTQQIHNKEVVTGKQYQIKYTIMPMFGIGAVLMVISLLIGIGTFVDKYLPKDREL